MPSPWAGSDRRWRGRGRRASGHGDPLQQGGSEGLVREEVGLDARTITLTLWKEAGESLCIM